MSPLTQHTPDCLLPICATADAPLQPRHVDAFDNKSRCFSRLFAAYFQRR